MTYFLFTSLILLKCQYFMKCWTEFSHVQSEWSANGFVPFMSLFTQIDHPKCLPLPLPKIAKYETDNISWTKIAKICHTDAFIELLIRRHKAGFDIAFRGILVLYIYYYWRYLLETQTSCSLLKGEPISVGEVILLLFFPWAEGSGGAYSMGSLRRPAVVRPHFQTTSPLKPQGQMWPNFICSIQALGERKIANSRWPPCTNMVKTLQKSSFPEPLGGLGWYFAGSIWGTSLYKIP